MKAKTILSASLFLATIASPASAQTMAPILSSDSAQTIVTGCEAYAKENGLKVNIAVLDQGKNLMAFLRMDDAPLGSIDIAMWKANGSAAFPRPTKTTSDRARDFPAIGHAPNIVIFEGGEAIFTESGSHLGGVGVSGAASADDAACGRAGIEAAGLKFNRN